MSARFVLLHEKLPGTAPRPIIVNLNHVKIIAANTFYGDYSGSLLLFNNQEEDSNSTVVTETFEEIRKNIPL